MECSVAGTTTLDRECSNLSNDIINWQLLWQSFFCQSEGHRTEVKSIWEDTDLSEKRFQRTQICAVKGHAFGSTVIL